MTTQTQNRLTKSDLAHFTGTENHYRYSPLLFRKILLTDGTKYVADQAGAYWLMDIISSMQLEPKVRNEGFQVWKLLLDDDSKTRSNMSSAVVTCEDGNGNEVYRQVIDSTNFPLDEIKFYLVDNVIMLPSEY